MIFSTMPRIRSISFCWILWNLFNAARHRLPQRFHLSWSNTSLFVIFFHFLALNLVLIVSIKNAFFAQHLQNKSCPMSNLELQKKSINYIWRNLKRYNLYISLQPDCRFQTRIIWSNNEKGPSVSNIVYKFY